MRGESPCRQTRRLQTSIIPGLRCLLVKRITIPKATVERLPLYLQCLQAMDEVESTVSSDTLATVAGVNSANVRKDLSYLGSHGVRGVGYNRIELCQLLRQKLGLTGKWPVVIVGVGNLGSALANYQGFDTSGFEVVGLYDADESRIGTKVDGHHVKSTDDLERDIKEHEVTMAILTTPAAVAQAVAEELVSFGITSILNFAPALLKLPEEITCRHVDLATELQILSYYQQ